MFIDIANTDKKYKVIYADPPWTFKTRTAAGKERSAEVHYDCLSFQDLCNLPIKNLADPSGCALFMWCTDPMFPKGFELMQKWGFTYKTIGFYWAKTNTKVDLSKLDSSKDFFTGMGYYTRANPEPCLAGDLNTEGVQVEDQGVNVALLGTARGLKNPKVQNRGVRKLIVSKRREHSRKPDEAYDRIESLMDGPYLELFARTERKGWDCWGNETTKFTAE